MKEIKSDLPLIPLRDVVVFPGIVTTLFVGRSKSVEALNVAMSTNHLDTIRMMVSIGMGWSVLPHTLVNDQIKVIDTLAKPITRQLGCVWHPQRSLSNAAQAFMELLQHHS